MGQAYKNDPVLALQSFEYALELQLRHNPNDFHTLAVMYNNMGFAHHQLKSGKHLVLDYYEKGLHMCTSLTDKNKIDQCLMATILNNLVTAGSQDDLDVALGREQLVLDIRLKYLPLSHPLVATTHKTLPQIYLSRGEFKEALKHSDEALRIKLKYLPNSDPSIASVYANLALLYLYKGDYEATEDQKDASEESYTKSLELNRQAFDILLSRGSPLSVDHDLVSFVYNNCGVVYIRLGRLEEALDCFNTETNTSIKQLPENHDYHGASLKNKGKIFTLQGNMSKGTEYHKQAIKFYNGIGLPNSFRIAQIYYNIGEWHEISGQNDLAAVYYDRAVQIGSEIVKSNHPFLLQFTKALDKVKRATILSGTIGEASLL